MTRICCQCCLTGKISQSLMRASKFVTPYVKQLWVIFLLPASKTLSFKIYLYPYIYPDMCIYSRIVAWQEFVKNRKNGSENYVSLRICHSACQRAGLGKKKRMSVTITNGCQLFSPSTSRVVCR